MSVPPAVPPRPELTSLPPVCPRHPDRISYVRCQRCGRPVCPECQRPAAVGVQCVDCVAEAARTPRTPRSALGAPLRSGRPTVTIGIVALSVASYLAQRVLPGWTSRWIFAPNVGEVEPFRFLSTAFLHSTAGFTHILFNMVALWMVGPYLETTLGRLRYGLLYALSAVGGSVGVLLLATPGTLSWVQGVVGASGAVFGLFGAVLVVLRRLGGDARNIVVVIVLNGVIGFVVPGIAWQAHLGGLVVGALLGGAYAYAPARRRRAVGAGATVGVSVLLVVLAAARYAVA